MKYKISSSHDLLHNPVETTSKPNRPVSIVLNNDNRLEPDGTLVNRRLGFEATP